MLFVHFAHLQSRFFCLLNPAPCHHFRYLWVSGILYSHWKECVSCHSRMRMCVHLHARFKQISYLARLEVRNLTGYLEFHIFCNQHMNKHLSLLELNKITVFSNNSHHSTQTLSLHRYGIYIRLVSVCMFLSNT